MLPTCKDIISKAILFYFFVSIYNVAYCQNENNVWVFGKYASINFIGGTPVIVNNSQMSSEEGSSSISDSLGNLLFYSNGEKVWDKNNNILPNGNNLLGSQSTTQAALFVPFPGSTNKFYLFTINQLGGNMYYSIIDKTLNNGFGDVVLNSKNILLHNNVSEKQIALKRCDENVWLVSHSATNNHFFADLITPQGINSSIISSTGSSHAGGSPNGTNTVGQMKFSQQGSRIGVAVRDLGIFELFDFDVNTGIVSNPISIGQGAYSLAYGVEFSPDGTKFYGSSILNGIYQFDLTQITQNGIQNSALTIGGASSQRGQLQLASDGKIYVAQCISQFSPGLQSLNVIQNPNAIGINCNYSMNLVNLGNGQSLLGLPNFMLKMNSKQYVTKNFSICKNDSIKIGTIPGLNSYQWALGSNSVTDSIIVSPSSSTTYIVHSSNNCLNRVDTINIHVDNVPVINAGNDTSICEGAFIVLKGSGGLSYSWNNNVTNNVPFSPSTTSTYSVTGTDVNGCSSVDSITIVVNNKPIIVKSNDRILCLGDSTSIFANGADTIIWNNGIQNNSYFLPTTTKYYAFTAVNINGCTVTDSVKVVVNPLPNIHGNDTTVCLNQKVILQGTGGITYIWSDGVVDGEPFTPINDTSRYILTGYDINGCSNVDTVVVVVNNNIMPVAILIPSQVKGESPLEVVFTNNSTDAIMYYWDLGNGIPIEKNDTSGETYFFVNEGVYFITLTAVNGICIDTSTIKITVINSDEVYVPNSFTPDGDEFNNIFIPVLTKGYDIYGYKLEIYNRFGELIFESENVNLGWDGTYKGLKSPDGTYVWKLKVKDKYSGFVSTKIGHVTLLR